MEDQSFTGVGKARGLTRTEKLHRSTSRSNRKMHKPAIIGNSQTAETQASGNLIQ